MRSLVVSLTRFGDLLQTQPVFTGLNAAGDEVGLLCLQNFRAGAGLTRHVDQVFEIPGAGLLAELDQGWSGALGHLLAWAKDLRESFRPERIINLTPSLAGRLLCRVLADSEPLGFGLDELGFGTYSSAWAAFLEASSKQRGCSPFNLVDLFWNTAHLGPGPRVFRLADPSPECLRRADELIEAAAPSGLSGLLGLQLGASAAGRQWPAEYFAKVAGELWTNRGLFPVLLGIKGEEGLAQAFCRTWEGPCLDLVGQTSLGELAAVVSRLRLLVTNDTGTMHLAAGLGVPVLAVFLATAQPWDTGPYLAGSCCLEPDLDCHPCGFSQTCANSQACLGAVRPEAALAYARGFLDSGRWPELKAEGVRAWETVVTPEHYLDLKSLSGHEVSDRTIWNRIQRHGWRRFLDGREVAFPAGEFPLPGEGLRLELLEFLHRALGLLEVLWGQAQVLKLTAKPTARNKFMATWQALENHFTAHPAFSAMAHLWLHLSQAHGQGLDHFEVFCAQVRDFLLSVTALLSSSDPS